MTDLSFDDRGKAGQLASLAHAAVEATRALGATIRAALDGGGDARAAVTAAAAAGQGTLSAELIELAVSQAGGATHEALANKLAFQLLSAVPTSPVVALLTAVAARAHRRAGAALGALVDADDLLSMLRWKLWKLSALYFAPDRILKHPGLAAYLSVMVRRIVIDECRAMNAHGRVELDAESIERSVDPRATLDEVLDDLDLLRRLATELPEWQAPLIDVLAGQLDRDEGLAAINRSREPAGLPPWSAESMRTGVHRARARLRELLRRSPSLTSAAPSTADGVADARIVHDWRRFWSARDGTYSLGDAGFLFDPESRFGRHFHECAALDGLAEVPCVVLLGEPGSGKSTAVRQEAERLRAAGHRVVEVDLSIAGDPATLRRCVAEANAAASSLSFLLFDSLDEGLATNADVAANLVTAIEQVESDHVRVRIVCRTLVWREDLEQRLQDRWPAPTMRVLEILPLRRIDVTAAAHDHGLDAGRMRS